MTTTTTPAAAVSLHIAATSCEHVISAACIKLYFDPTKPGHNALNQLGRRLDAAATARESALIAERDSLRVALDVLRPIGALIRTQDNRCTDQPMFIVQQRHIVFGIDTGYTDSIAWIDSDSSLMEGEEFDAFEAAYKADGTTPEGWTRSGYHEQWEYVTACFTEQGCKDFLAINGHNLKEPRIYADGSYRNNEFRTIRNTLIALSAPAVEGV